MAPRSVALLTVPLWLCFFGCLCDQHVYPSVGTFFVHKLDMMEYQQRFLNKSGQLLPITFHANLLGFPDLPRWLRYSQRSPWHSAYLYGSPTTPDKHVIEVTVYNRKTFEILREKIIINILSATEAPPPYEAEFLVTNVDVEEMLPPETRHDFQVPLQELWDTQRLFVINVTSALDKGGRVPLPLPGLKEGQKRDAATSEIQLVHQQSIFSNTEELRHMAANRDVPRPLSTLPMFNVRTGQRTSPMELSGDSAHVPLILSQQ
ncbi:hypothetical protein GDO81_013287 [Engystomops pustulosus]|uniref:Dystroglycan-type cadherin-like domain-containing protein n=1 Tax=Engystomops pustulosus TaxID=76066 RepID=A0AAV7AZ84_ENGPU|nr:hypothetical protein GDO81_013287 [Engystomops pustulosus]